MHYVDLSGIYAPMLHVRGSTLKGSSALQTFSDNRIMFDFYPGLPHVPVRCTIVPSYLFTPSSFPGLLLPFAFPLPSSSSPRLHLHLHCFPGEAILPAPEQTVASVHQSKEWRQPRCQAHADLPVAAQPSSGLWSVQGWTQVWVRLWPTLERVMTTSVVALTERWKSFSLMLCSSFSLINLTLVWMRVHSTSWLRSHGDCDQWIYM